MSKQQPKVDPKLLEMRVITPPSFLQFLSYMTNPDEVLRDTGEAISFYRQMKTDARIRSLLAVAKSAVLNYPVQLEPRSASTAALSTMKDALDSLPFYEIEKRLLSGLEYGYSVVELIWKNLNGWWIPIDAVLRRPERFVFDSEGKLSYLRHGEPVSLADQPYKWLIFRHDKDAENPYGTALMKSCYWPWMFKKAGAEFWLMATEKFAVASILALFESTEGEEVTRKRAEALSQMISSMRSGSGAAVANIKDAKVIEASGDVGAFKTLVDWCDTQFSYAITYQSLMTQEAQMGTRSTAQVHETAFLEASKGRCRDLAPVLQRYVDWIVELNYGEEEPRPSAVFDLADYAGWREVTDAIDRGVPVSQSALYSRYGLPKPADGKDTFLKPAGIAGPAAFADDIKKKRWAPRPLLIRYARKN